MLAALRTNADIGVGIVPPKPPPRIASIPPKPKPRKAIPKMENKTFVTEKETTEQIITQELENHDSEQQDEDTQTSLIIDAGAPVELVKSESEVTLVDENLNDDNDKKLNDDTLDDISDYKPPEIVGVILKKSASKDSIDTMKYDSGLQKSNFNADNETTSGNSSLYSSLVQTDHDDDDMMIDDLDVQMFTVSPSKNLKQSRIPLKHLHSVQEFGDARSSEDMPKNRSVTSLKSIDSLPSFMDSNSMKKWTNYQDLDEISDISDHVSPKNKWVVGDATDTGMFPLY